MKKTLGGDRLGSGNKMQVDLHNYGRSTHNMGYLWRSTMSAGTLVPFMSQVGLPGDTFDIDLDCDVKTHPTVGPLFGSFKVQLDIFMAPIRLYQGALHNNKLGIGLRMSAIKLPQFELTVNDDFGEDLPVDIDNSQINPSSIFAYLGLRGVGSNYQANEEATRRFNALPWLGYWDIYKNYYANKQEEIGAVIHTPPEALVQLVTGITINGGAFQQFPTVDPTLLTNGTVIVITSSGSQPLNQIIFNTVEGNIPANELGDVLSDTGTVVTISYNVAKYGIRTGINWFYIDSRMLPSGPITVQTFALTDIDAMREWILSNAATPTALLVNDSAGAPGSALEPWSFILNDDDVSPIKPRMGSQEGLGIKTYQSDLFNNWLQTDWIDGTNGINEITAIDTSGGSFDIDTLLMARKVYDMLNRIAVSGGSYDDWLDAVYTEDRYKRCETPMYMGGLIKELVFQEVVSNSESSVDNGAQPLGTLAGKGVLGRKHKGGHITVKVDEPCYIIGIVSLTPRIDYSQGNQWDLSLETMDDLHKPALDEIGFQELITEQMAWWDTNWDGTQWVTKSAGKQPAWVNYMTNVNKVCGNFAIEGNEMYMTLNRKFRPENNGGDIAITDLTTYVDPEKYNSLFAQTSLDSQNYWVQIALDMKVRRKLSAKLMPNL